MVRKTENAGSKMVPPEGGYGWVVAFGCLLNTVMLSVPTLAFGVLLKDMIGILGVSTSTASWTISIQLWMSQIISPICTMSINIFSCRKTAMAGGIVVAMGLTLSYFSTSIIALYITFGLITGIGIGLARIPTIVVGSQYFVKRYTIISGITFAGFSIGRVVFTPIAEKIKEEYGYESTYLLLGGICLNILVGTAFFQPVQRYLVPEKPVVTKEESNDRASQSKEQPSRTIKAEEIRNTNHYVNLPDSSFKNGFIEMKPIASNVPTASNDARTIEEQESLLSKTQYSNVYECDDNSNGLVLNPLYGFSSRDSINNLKEVVCRPKTNKGKVIESPSKAPQKPLSKKAKIKNSLKNSLDISLLKEPIFYIVCANSVLSYLTIMYSTAFLIPLAKEKGISPMESSLIYSAKAGAEILGRLGFPFIQKFVKINVLLFYIIICGLVGSCILGQALVSGFIPFIIFAVLSGFVTGGTVVMSIGVMMASVGVKRYSSSLGLTCFIQGWFALFGGPLVGFVRDLFGNFSICYVLITALQLVAILMWGSRYSYLRWWAPKEKQPQQEGGIVRR